MITNEESEIFPIIYLVTVVLLMIYAIAGAIFEIKHFHWIHETGLGIILGWMFGAIVFWVAKSQESGYGFPQTIFFYGLLPPMIFEGGYNLRKTLVFKNFAYIAIFGVIGTLIAFLVVTGLTFGVNSLQLIRDFNDQQTVVSLSTATILIYSATICATDSVAALTMIKANEYPKLFSIVFGEGMINDAVAIILFRSVTEIFDQKQHQPFNFEKARQIFGKFIANLVYSFLIGLGAGKTFAYVGVLCALIFKHARFITKNIVAEVMLSLFFGLFAYSFAQYCQYSGVIAIFICGITMGHYNFYNLTTNGKISTGLFFKFISFIAESFIFVFLGFSSWNYFGNQHHEYSWSWTFVILQLLVCTVARFVSVFVLSGIVYLACMRKSWKVNIYELGIIWFAGVIRGSVAFALILTVDEPHDDPHVRREVQIIKSSVLFIVFITTIVLGALMPGFIKCSLNRAARSQNNDLESGLTLQQQQQQREALLQKKKKKPGFFKTMDDGFFKPWFIRDYEQKKQIMAEEKRLMKLSSKEYKGVRQKSLAVVHDGLHE